MTDTAPDPYSLAAITEAARVERPIVRRVTAPSVFRQDDLDEVWRFAQMVATTELVPASYRNRPAAVLAAIQYGRELGLAPMQALQGITVIHGQTTVWGTTGRGIVMATPGVKAPREWIEGEGDNAVAFCEIEREPFGKFSGRFSVADAKTANLWKKNKTPWCTYPMEMLAWKAFWRAARKACPDSLRGINLYEDMVGHDEIVETKRAAPAATETEKPASKVEALADEVAGPDPVDDVEVTDLRDPNLVEVCEAIDNEATRLKLDDIGLLKIAGEVSGAAVLDRAGMIALDVDVLRNLRSELESRR